MPEKKLIHLYDTNKPENAFTLEQANKLWKKAKEITNRDFVPKDLVFKEEQRQRELARLIEEQKQDISAENIGRESHMKHREQTLDLDGITPEEQEDIHYYNPETLTFNEFDNPQVSDLTDHDILNENNGELTPEEKTFMPDETKKTPENKYKPLKPWLAEKLQLAGIEVNELTQGNFDHKRKSVIIQQKDRDGRILYNMTKTIAELNKKIEEKEGTKKPIGMSKELHKKTNKKDMSPESFKPKPKTVEPKQEEFSGELFSGIDWSQSLTGPSQEAMEEVKAPETLTYQPLAGSEYAKEIARLQKTLPEDARFAIRGDTLDLIYKNNGNNIHQTYNVNELKNKSENTPEEKVSKEPEDTLEEKPIFIEEVPREPEEKSEESEYLEPIIVDEGATPEENNEEPDSLRPLNLDNSDLEEKKAMLEGLVRVSRDAFAKEYALYKKESKNRNSEAFQDAKQIYNDNKREMVTLLDQVSQGDMSQKLAFLQDEQNKFEQAVAQHTPESTFKKGLRWMSEKYNNLSPRTKTVIKYTALAGTAALGTFLNPAAGVGGTLTRMAVGMGAGALVNKVFKLNSTPETIQTPTRTGIGAKASAFVNKAFGMISIDLGKRIQNLQEKWDGKALNYYANNPQKLQENLKDIEKKMRENKAFAKNIKRASIAATIGATAGATILVTGNFDSIKELATSGLELGSEGIEKGSEALQKGAEWLRDAGEAAAEGDGTDVINTDTVENPLETTVPAEPFEVVQPEGTFDIPHNSPVPTPDQITLDQLDNATLETEHAPKQPDAFVATPENIPQEAYVEAGSGEGFTHVMRDQIMADPELANSLGYEGGDLKKFASSKAWEIAQAQGYADTGLMPYGENKIAYVLNVNENGSPVVTKFLNGEVVNDLSNFEYSMSGKASGVSVDTSGLGDGRTIDTSGLGDGRTIDTSGLGGDGTNPDGVNPDTLSSAQAEKMSLPELQSWMDANYGAFLDRVREVGTDGVMEINGREIPFKEMYIDNPPGRILVGEYRGTEFTVVETAVTDPAGNVRPFHLLDLDNDGFIDRIGFNLTETGDNSYLLFESERALEKKILRGDINAAAWGNAEIVDFDKKGTVTRTLMNPAADQQAVSEFDMGTQAVNTQQETLLNEYKKFIDRTMLLDASAGESVSNAGASVETAPFDAQELAFARKVGQSEQQVLDAIFEANVQRNRGINSPEWLAIKNLLSEDLMNVDPRKITDPNIEELHAYFTGAIERLAQDNIVLQPEKNETLEAFLRRTQETLIKNNINLNPSV